MSGATSFKQTIFLWELPWLTWACSNFSSSVDDLLRAGINKASHLVVVNREKTKQEQSEEVLGDAETIVAVQTIFKYVLHQI